MHQLTDSQIFGYSLIQRAHLLYICS